MVRTRSQFFMTRIRLYCVAYRIFDVVSSYEVDNCCEELMGDLESLLLLVKGSPRELVSMLEEIVEKNPDNTSLISSVEVVISKTEQYISFIDNKEGDKGSVIDLLREATKKATAINANSVFYKMEEQVKDSCELSQ